MRRITRTNRFLVAAALSLYGIAAHGYDFKVDGICYNKKSGTECEVTYEDYPYYDAYDNLSGGIVIPESVEYDGTEYSVTSIGDKAFYGCIGLTSVDIGNSVTSIGSSAFYNCYRLTSVDIPNSVTSIGESAFYDCDRLTSVDIGNSVTSIGASAFSDCSGLTSVDIPNSVTSIGRSAFSDCTSLTSVDIPNSVTSIGGSAFSGCTSLTSVDIPNSVTSIGESAFSDCDSLTSVDIPNSVTDIGYRAFAGCTGLTSVYIPNSVTSIGYEAFYGCSGLTSVTIGTSVQSIGDGAFYSSSPLDKLILLPNTMPENLGGAFDSGHNNRVIHRTYVANDNYSGSYLGEIKKLDYLSSMFEVGGVRYVPVSPSERTCTAIDCTYSPEDTSIVIGQTVSYSGVEMKVVELNPYTLSRNDYIKSIEVSATAEIPEYFATDCDSLQTIKIGSSITDIGESAFSGCTRLQEVNIPSGVTAIERSCFAYCSSLASVTLPEKLVSIDEDAFWRSGLKSIVIPAATTDIAEGAFYECDSLARFIAEDGEQELRMGRGYYYSEGHGMFHSSPLKEVKIGRNLVYSTSASYGYSPFYRVTTLETVELTDIPTEVFTNEFYGCSSLKKVSIGDGVTRIGNYAFSGCTSLESFSFGAGMDSIGDEAFSDCTAMTELYAEPSVPPTCGTQALDDINKWNCKLYVPEGAADGYRAADQWKEFFFVESHDFADAVGGVTATPEADASYRIHRLDGTAVRTGRGKPDFGGLPKGIYVVSGKKVLVQ